MVEIHEAKALPEGLDALRTDDAGAARFYVALGFAPTAEDDATHVMESAALARRRFP